MQEILVTWYNLHYPRANVVGRMAVVDPNFDPNFIRPEAFFHRYAILDGRRITPSLDVYNAPHAIVQARYGNTRFVGQVHHIITHMQPGIGATKILFHVSWFEPLEKDVFNTTIWDER